MLRLSRDVAPSLATCESTEGRGRPAQSSCIPVIKREHSWDPRGRSPPAGTHGAFPGAPEPETSSRCARRAGACRSHQQSRSRLALCRRQPGVWWLGGTVLDCQPRESVGPTSVPRPVACLLMLRGEEIGVPSGLAESLAKRWLAMTARQRPVLRARCKSADNAGAAGWRTLARRAFDTGARKIAGPGRPPAMLPAGYSSTAREA
jgi:hypothetical protein